MLKIIRLVFFIPAMFLGAFLSVIINAIVNIPITFLEYLMDIFKNWELLNITSEIFRIFSFHYIYVFSSGFFMSLFGLFFALSVFPYPKHRNKISYLLFLILFILFINPIQLDFYNGSILLYVFKIVGIIIGFVVIHFLLKNQEKYFNFIDNKNIIQKNK